MKNFRSIPRQESYPGTPPFRRGALETPAGPVSFLTDGERVCRVWLGRRIAGKRRTGALEREVKRQLAEYFAGRRKAFDVPLALAAPAFTSAVLHSVARIPFGRTRSYGEIARALGKPGAARAVGQAVGANPLPLLVPCHRVLAAGGRLGGFGGGLEWKRFLLALEGSACHWG